MRLLRLLPKISTVRVSKMGKLQMIYGVNRISIEGFKSKIEDPAENRIFDIIKKVQGIDKELKPNMELSKDLGVNSSNLVPFLNALEKELLFNIPIEKAITFTTLADLLRYLSELEDKRVTK
ncbi:hypothetical protein K502DRAFT_342815 [Neoconidiobolus thromboides FSU 785]|nr:hypothetical protein K502DRAFT_342815 [Neoconidiobolus thromboides FSU 785]